VDDMILYLKSPKDSTRKFLESNKHFWQISRIQNQHTKLIAFLYTNNEQAEKEIRK
jgi:hypothetical protein